MRGRGGGRRALPGAKSRRGGGVPRRSASAARRHTPSRPDNGAPPRRPLRMPLRDALRKPETTMPPGPAGGTGIGAEAAAGESLWGSGNNPAIAFVREPPRAPVRVCPLPSHSVRHVPPSLPGCRTRASQAAPGPPGRRAGTPAGRDPPAAPPPSSAETA